MRPLSNTEKGMLFMIALFIIGIAVRWEFISSELMAAIDNMFGK